MVYNVSLNKLKEVLLEEHILELGSLNPKKNDLVRVINQNVANTYKIYIDDDVAEPHNYREVFDTLLSANESDMVVMDINTYGGDLHSCIAIVNAIRDCQAHTVAEVTQASSAGSFIALACDTCIPMPHSYFFIHEVQHGGGYGSNSTHLNRVLFMQKKQEAFFRDVYEGFLSEQEIEELLKGSTKEGMYIDSEEAKLRLELREEYFKKKYAENCKGNCGCGNTVLEVSEDDSKVLNNFYAEYKEAKEFTKDVIDNIKKGKFNIEDLTVPEMIDIEFYLNYCDRELIELEEMILERLDYLRDGNMEDAEDE